MPCFSESPEHPSKPTRSCVGQIDRGWLILLGVAEEDSRADAEWLAEKVLDLRGFEDEQGKMNLSVAEVKGSIEGRQPVHAPG